MWMSLQDNMLRRAPAHLLKGLCVMWLLKAVSASSSMVWDVPTALSSSSTNTSFKAMWEQQCAPRHYQQGDGRITALIPPRLEGNWVSSHCEVRPGPEFVTRSYIFYSNRLFKALQFYYADSSCQEPSYTLLVRGKLRLRQASWITRGGTEAEHTLHKVGVVFHTSSALRRLSPRLPPDCLCAGLACFATGRLYELYTPRVGRDCLGKLGFSMQELGLLRVETQHLPHGGQVQELFLGDIHTDWSQRTHYQPTGYQHPLQNAMHHIHPCPVCSAVYRATEQRPPALPAIPTLALRLEGRWVSLSCEARPSVLFLTRDFTFHEEQRVWWGVYRHYSDPTCQQPTFTMRAAGHYARGGSCPKVRGASELVFKVTEAWVTPQDKGMVRLLNSSRVGTCGFSRWEIGVEQEVSSTHGCEVLGIKLPHKEYELFKADLDHMQRRLLLTGERPTDGSSPDRPQQRPTSFQAPLVQCVTDTPDPHHHGNRASFSYQFAVNRVASLQRLLCLIWTSLFISRHSLTL